jgi:hypothetical protein
VTGDQRLTSEGVVIPCWEYVESVMTSRQLFRYLQNLHGMNHSKKEQESFFKTPKYPKGEVRNLDQYCIRDYSGEIVSQYSFIL